MVQRLRHRLDLTSGEDLVLPDEVYPRDVSDDGTSVSFTTREALVTEDLDDRRDVYRYNIDTGTYTLISIGFATHNVSGGIEISGDSRFISWDSRLIPGAIGHEWPGLCGALVGPISGGESGPTFAILRSRCGRSRAGAYSRSRSPAMAGPELGRCGCAQSVGQLSWRATDRFRGSNR